MRNIVIIGGSKGIGRSILIQQLDRHLCHNISRTAPDMEHERLTHHPCDVLTDALPLIEKVDCLVYCPGTITLKPIMALKPADFERDFQLNVMGAVKAIRHFLPALKNGHGPSITLFSTVAVKRGMPFHASVAVAKAGVEALTRSLAAELSPAIRVNCIAPTVTHTTLAKSILRNAQAVEKAAERHPLKRIPEADDVAFLADYLMGEQSRHMTGQVIGLDGGLSTLST